MSGGIPLSSGFNVGAGIPLELKKIQPTLASRDAIPEIQRYEGLEVYVESEEKYFYLKGGITNSDWEERASGSGDNYVHPTYINYPNGFYKITTNTLGHVTAATAVIKSDITSLGIPGQDTVYTHPNHNSQTSGLYKITVDSLGHVSEVTSVIASDIIGLGIPAQDTTYATITQLEIINGTVTADRVITPKLLVDNFSKIGHTHSLSSADISGPLPVSKGGTGATTAVANRIPYWSSTTLLSNTTTFLWNNSTRELTIGSSSYTTTAYTRYINNYHSSGFDVGISDTQARIWVNSARNLIFGTNNTQRFSITSAGVGSFAGLSSALTLPSHDPSAANHAVRKGWADDTYALKKAKFVTKSNAFTLVLTDAYKDLMCSGTSEWATTIPTNASVPFEIGTRINIYRTGTGVRRIDAASGVTVYGDRYIRKRYRVVQLVKYAINTWYIIGGEE